MKEYAVIKVNNDPKEFEKQVNDRAKLGMEVIQSSIVYNADLHFTVMFALLEKDDQVQSGNSSGRRIRV